MGRAKSLCEELSESSLYLSILDILNEKNSIGLDGPFQELTNRIEKEIKIQRIGIGANHRIGIKIEKNMKCISSRGRTQEQVININMVQYLNSLEKYSNNFLSEWYNRVDHKIFSLKN